MKKLLDKFCRWLVYKIHTQLDVYHFTFTIRTDDPSERWTAAEAFILAPNYYEARDRFVKLANERHGEENWKVNYTTSKTVPIMWEL